MNYGYIEIQGQNHLFQLQYYGYIYLGKFQLIKWHVVIYIKWDFLFLASCIYDANCCDLFLFCMAQRQSWSSTGNIVCDFSSRFQWSDYRYFETYSRYVGLLQYLNMCITCIILVYNIICIRIIFQVVQGQTFSGDVFQMAKWIQNSSVPVTQLPSEMARSHFQADIPHVC